MEVITAHRDAMEAGDSDAALATLTDDATAVWLISPIAHPTVLSRDRYVGLRTATG